MSATERLLSFLPLRLLNFDVVSSKLHVGQGPIIDLVIPLSSALDPHVLKLGNELIDEKVLEANFPSQLSDAVHQVFSLAMNLRLQVIQLLSLLLHLDAKLLSKPLFILKLIMLRCVSLLDIKSFLIFGLELLRESHLQYPLLLELGLGLHEVLLLLERLLHGLVAVQYLLLHVLDLLEQLLLLRLLLARPLLLLLKLIEDSQLLALRHLRLLLNSHSLLLELLLDLKLLIG